MNPFKQLYWSLAWRNIWRNKRRTLITMASVVFAVLLAIVLNSVKEGLLMRMQENAVSFYTGAVQIHQQGYWEEKTLENTFESNPAMLVSVSNQKGVVSATNRFESFALAASRDHSKGCMVVGIEPETEPLITMIRDKVVEGKYLQANDKELLLTTGLAEYLKLGVGDTLVLIGQGYRGVNAVGMYPIKGLIELASPELNKQLVYLPIQLARYLYGAEGRSTALILKLDDIDEAESIAQQVASQLPAYEVMDWKRLLPELNQIIERERDENVIFLGVLYLLISFGIFGTILMMLMERQYEFGVLVAIGMRREVLSAIVILENILISVMGALIGTLFSIPLVWYFYRYPIEVGGQLKEIYEDFGFEPIFYFSVEPWIFYSQTILVLGIALVLSFYPIVKLLRLKPIAAMRS